MPKINGTWLGGYIRNDKKGRKTFIIRKSVNGKRYEASTYANTQRAALKQLERFEMDPENYRPQGEERRDPLYLTEKLAQEFLDWSRDQKENSTQWRGSQRRFLVWWGTKLHQLDLRGEVTLADHVTPALDAEPTSRKQRIAVIKRFYSWLRKIRHDLRVEPQHDPTLGKLSVPQSDPKQWTVPKVIPRRDYLRVLAALDPKKEQHWRDAITVQLGTGWHVSEAIRFAQSGSIERHPKIRKSAALSGVLVCPKSKRGHQIRVAVSGKVLKAAKGLLAYGSFTYKGYTEGITRAAERAGVERFQPGRFRHTVLTDAVNSGEEPERVSAFVNHGDKRTSMRFYATYATPAKVKTPA